MGVVVLKSVHSVVACIELSLTLVYIALTRLDQNLLMLLQFLSIKIPQKGTIEHSTIAWKATCPLRLTTPAHRTAGHAIHMLREDPIVPPISGCIGH
jgi:hypothetical protein